MKLSLGVLFTVTVLGTGRLVYDVAAFLGASEPVALMAGIATVVASATVIGKAGFAACRAGRKAQRAFDIQVALPRQLETLVHEVEAVKQQLDTNNGRFDRIEDRLQIPGPERRVTDFT